MTATWRTREELAHQVALLAKQDTPIRAMARALGVGRKIIRQLCAAHVNERASEHAAVTPRPRRAPRATKLDTWRPRLVELLTRFPDITAQRVFENYFQQCNL